MALTDKIDQMVRVLNDMRDAYDTLDNGNLVNKKAVMAKLELWVNGAAGHLLGYEAEFRDIEKNFINKSRPLALGRADVTTGVDFQTKSTQHKSTIQAEWNVVSQMIAEAANQLSGERGEMPIRQDASNASDRHIIHVAIRNPLNPWPYSAPGSNRRTDGDVRNQACSVLRSLLKDYQKHVTSNKRKRGTSTRIVPQKGKGLSPEVIDWLSDLDNSDFAGGELMPDAISDAPISGSSSRSTIAIVKATNGKEYVLKTVIVKIRYELGYSVNIGDPPNTSEGQLFQLVFCAYKEGSKLRVVEFKQVYKLKTDASTDAMRTKYYYTSLS